MGRRPAGSIHRRRRGPKCGSAAPDPRSGASTHGVRTVCTTTDGHRGNSIESRGWAMGDDRARYQGTRKRRSWIGDLRARRNGQGVGGESGTIVPIAGRDTRGATRRLRSASGQTLCGSADGEVHGAAAQEGAGRVRTRCIVFRKACELELAVHPGRRSTGDRTAGAARAHRPHTRRAPVNRDDGKTTQYSTETDRRAFLGPGGNTRSAILDAVAHKESRGESRRASDRDGTPGSGPKRGRILQLAIWRAGGNLAPARNTLPIPLPVSDGSTGREWTWTPKGAGSLLRMFKNVDQGQMSLDVPVTDEEGNVSTLRVTARVRHSDGRPFTVPDLSEIGPRVVPFDSSRNSRTTSVDGNNIPGIKTENGREWTGGLRSQRHKESRRFAGVTPLARRLSCARGDSVPATTG